MNSVQHQRSPAKESEPITGYKLFPNSIRRPQKNQRFLSAALYGQRSGKGCLPTKLGLSKDEFISMLNRHFQGLQIPVVTLTDSDDKASIREELLELRESEWQDLFDLISKYARGIDVSEQWLAKIIATGCMGSDHLWRDLGLPDRQSLRLLFEENFPALASKNDSNMRWKKFLYRQLCETGGHFVCRSPSCETCPTYDECFGDEI